MVFKLTEAEAEALRPLTVPQAAALRGIGRSTLSRAARSRALAAERIGRYWVTSLAAVDEWLARHGGQPGPKPGAGTAYTSKRARQTGDAADRPQPR